ncbi:MAG: selenocysteine-specific elongation factor [Actinomycetota bacterium]|jgi:selenocysteine-specific elongation factor|nr:selenocysteine-specific elongation factor [Actinomycetota bacterium]
MHVIGTAGHVDHGKSTLVERLTGIDPDRFAEEKRRGLTIDLGFAWLTLPSGNEIGLIDVPGHERFISNMLSGAGGISICLFVVAANEGWKPQSAEHLSIIHTLGISTGVVALTKADSVGPETLATVKEDVSRRIDASSLRGAKIVACSAVTGQGIDELVASLDEVIQTAPSPSDLGTPRLWIDRVFTISGAGTVVTGTLNGGQLNVGDEIELAPRSRTARIRAIQSHKKEVSNIGPGNRTALNLVGLERTGTARGDVVVKPGGWPVTRRFDAEVTLAPSAMTGREHELTAKGSHLLYVGSAETPVRIKLPTGPLRSGETGPAQIVLQEPLPLRRGDRFVLRDAGRIATIGGGRVLDPLPRAARRRDPIRADLLRRLGGSDVEALTALLEDEGAIPQKVALFRAGLLATPAGVIELGGALMSASHLETLESQLIKIIEEHHSARPLDRGIQREALRAETGLAAEEFDALLARCEGVAVDGSVVGLGTHSVELSPEQTAERARIVETIEAGGFAPPLARELNTDPALLRSMTETGELVRIGEFYLTAANAQRARQLVRQRIGSDGSITVAGIRDLLGTSRKYAVPLCEWLDETGATRRQGDLRVLGPKE